MHIIANITCVMKNIHRYTLTAALSLLFCSSAIAAEHAAGLKLVSNKNPDASSVEQIIKDIIKPGMSDQEKAEAVFEYVVTHFYHHEAIEEPNGAMLSKQNSFSENTKLVDTIKQVNVYAHGLCGSQSKYQNELFNAAGLLGRVNGVNGHTAPEVKYDGSWHYLDSDMMGFVRDRAGKIPSIDDIKANKNLLFDKHAKQPSYNFKFDGPNSMWGCLKDGVKYSMYGRKVGVHSMNLSLRDGETFTRYFNRQWAPDYRYYVPAVDCSYSRLLRKTKQGPQRDKSYYLFTEAGVARFGNWELIYKPDLKKTSFLDASLSTVNVKHQKKQPYLKADKDDVASELVLNYYSPYGCAGTAGDLTTNDDDRNGYILEGEFNNNQGELSYSFDLGASWTRVHTGGGAFKLDLTPAFLTKYGWQIKISFSGKGAGLKSFSSYLSGQLSPASLPFVDGDTEMTFTRSDLDCLLYAPDVSVSEEEFKRTAHQVEGFKKWTPSISGHVQGNGSVVYKIDAPGEIVSVQAGAKFGGRKGIYEVAFSVDDGATWQLAAKQKSVYNEAHSEEFWGQSLEGFIDFEQGRAYSPGCIKVKGNVWESKCPTAKPKSVLVRFKYQGGSLCKVYGIYAHYKKPGALPVTLTHTWKGGEHTETIKADERNKTYTVKGGQRESNVSIRMSEYIQQDWGHGAI